MSNAIVVRLTTAMGLLVSAAGILRAGDPVVITDSGSTNTASFRIEIGGSGEATFTPVARREGMISPVSKEPMTRRVPGALLKRLLADLEGAKPFSGLPRQGCMKSASFGTTLVMEYQGQKTPDLRCGDRGSAKLKALIQDYGDVVGIFRGAGH